MALLFDNSIKVFVQTGPLPIPKIHPVTGQVVPLPGAPPVPAAPAPIITPLSTPSSATTTSEMKSAPSPPAGESKHAAHEKTNSQVVGSTWNSSGTAEICSAYSSMTRVDADEATVRTRAPAAGIHCAAAVHRQTEREAGAGTGEHATHGAVAQRLNDDLWPRCLRC